MATSAERLRQIVKAGPRREPTYIPIDPHLPNTPSPEDIGVLFDDRVGDSIARVLGDNPLARKADVPKKKTTNKTRMGNIQDDLGLDTSELGAYLGLTEDQARKYARRGFHASVKHLEPRLHQVAAIVEILSQRYPGKRGLVDRKNVLAGGKEIFGTSMATAIKEGFADRVLAALENTVEFNQQHE